MRERAPRPRSTLEPREQPGRPVCPEAPGSAGAAAARRGDAPSRLFRGLRVNGPDAPLAPQRRKAGKATVGMVGGPRMRASWLLCLLVSLPPRNALGFTVPAGNHTRAGSSPVPLLLETPGEMYEYVSTPLDWWRADAHCQQHFAQLPSEAQSGELASLGRKLPSHQVQGGVWLDGEEAFLQKPRRRRSHPALVLAFQDKTDTKFAKVRASFPALPALSACAHVQWDPGAAEVSTVFSYAVPAFINEFQLRGFVDEEGFVRFAVILHGHHSPYLPVFRADGRWHHFCVTWQEHGGAWAVFADGKRRAAATGLLASRAIGGRGTFIIGQDQDSLGGTFKKKESFSGNLTGLHLWRRVLSRGQVEGVRSCVPVVEGLLFAWDSSILEVEPSLLQATVQLTCPGPVEECRVFTPTRGGPADASCSQERPFLCRYKKDLYFQLKERQSRSVPPLAARVNTLANATVIPESVFQAEVQAINISAASDYLGVVEAVLSEVEPPQLDAAALLGVYQLLKKVSDVEADTPEQLPALEQLGQSFVQVAGILLEEENAEEWAEIKPITGGPMKLVENIDRMASNLHQLLSADRPKVSIQSKNVGVEVRRVELSTLAAGSAAYMMRAQHQDTPDQIEVPAEEVERLRVRGLHQVTVTNTWYRYGSLQRLLTADRAVSEDAAVSDGGMRYLSTQVGSSLISSTLVSDYEEVSTAVRYRLRHRAQGPVQPACWEHGAWRGDCSTCQTPSGRRKVDPGSRTRRVAWGRGSFPGSGTVCAGPGSAPWQRLLAAANPPCASCGCPQAFPDQLAEPVCAFWNFSRSPEGAGGWSTTGCGALASHADIMLCACNHTTNFAVLLQLYEVQRSAEEEATLKTLTFVGCGVSFCALIVTLVLFLAIGVPKSERTTVHKNLIFALAAAEALLMCSELAKTNQGVCFAVTAFLHLFFMAAFAWMLVEGLLLWSKVVAVNMSEDRRMRFYYVTGWGLPVVIVGVTLATSFNKYVADNHCWLNVQTDIIWAFVGPVLFVLMVNTVVLFRVVMVTVSSARRRSRMLTPNSSLEKQIGTQVWATARPVLVLLPVLGLTWVCGILVHFSINWAYVFIVLNSLQGLYIFLVYAIYNSEVRSAIQRMKEKKKALSFMNCSHPINYLSSPRNTSWERDKFNPSTPENTASPSSEKDAVAKNVNSKGNFGTKIPMGLALIMSPERPAVQLTAFKSSGL
ncbi:adhesion G-protein coupled receptor D2 [Varanus komodoensis]|uniref:adhesion G-protein coupled receptor D2 n=1 Tax=Varanus komodoensis TaxID=61221 RepID=UPI001CF7DD00|nr:adhesion G-protein coupled receptor D2 [Varanus komodoensis]